MVDFFPSFDWCFITIKTVVNILLEKFIKKIVRIYKISIKLIQKEIRQKTLLGL